MSLSWLFIGVGVFFLGVCIVLLIQNARTLKREFEKLQDIQDEYDRFLRGKEE